MRFISQTTVNKDNPQIATDKAAWFNKSLSDKLNVPIKKSYIVSNKKIGLGNTKYESEHCDIYQYKKETNIFEALNFEPEINKSDKRNLSKINKQLAENITDNKRKEFVTKKKNLEYISENVTISKQIKLSPNNKQLNILKKWQTEATNCYNKCVDLYTENNEYFKNGYKKAKLDVFKKLYDGNKLAPYDLLTDEVRKFCSNLKSCQSNLKNKHIKKFTMKHINMRKKSFTFFVPKSAIKNGAIYKTHLGTMNGLEKVDKLTRDCNITFDVKHKTYHLNTPYVIQRKEIKNREKICAIDEGEVCFASFHGEKTFGRLGSDMREEFMKHKNRISVLQKVLDTKKIQNKCSVKNQIQKKYEKIQNMAKELRNKVALYLCKNFDTILLPSFETQKMVMKRKYTKDYFNKIKKEKGIEEMKIALREATKKRRLNRKVKDSLNMQSHYKFKQHLINKANEYGCKLVLDVDENETTKTCTLCGSVKNEKKGRVRECLECGLKMDRDISASRNTLIKNANKKKE